MKTDEHSDKNWADLSPEEARQWDVDRYVLGDDTLDRESFEARMATDEQLAWQVAQSVGQVACFSSAAELASDDRGQASPNSVPAKPMIPAKQAISVRPVPARLMWTALATVAATVLVASCWGLLGRNSTGSADAIAAQDLPAVAAHWLALESEGEGEETLISNALEMDSTEKWVEDDWMVEAAQQFFQQEAEI